MEGILPAPESAHAIRAALDEAMKCKETGEEIPTDAELQAGFDGIPKI